MPFEMEFGNEKRDMVVAIFKKPYHPSVFGLDSQEEVYPILACNIIRNDKVLQPIVNPAPKSAAHRKVDIAESTTENWER